MARIHSRCDTGRLEGATRIACEGTRIIGSELPDDLPPEERAVLYGGGLAGEGLGGEAGGEPELVPREDVW